MRRGLSYQRLRYHTVWALARYIMKRRSRLWRYTKWLFMDADRLGIQCQWHGTDVVWIWPWKRSHREKPFYDINCGGSFATLAEIEAFWVGYNEACLTRWEAEANSIEP